MHRESDRAVLGRLRDYHADDEITGFPIHKRKNLLGFGCAPFLYANTQTI